MDLESKILIVGHTNLVGHAIRRTLESLGYHRLLLSTHETLDLTRQEEVEKLFSWERPDYVFLVAADTSDPINNECASAEVLYQGLATELNIITAARESGAKRLLFLGTGFLYPGQTCNHLNEVHILLQEMEGTNRAHAIARMIGIELCDAYNREDGCRFLAATPNSEYDPAQGYDLANSDLIPEMIVRIHHAKASGQQDVVLPGSANTRRSFLYSDDMANVCVSLMNLNEHDFESLVQSRSGPLISIGCEEKFTMRTLAQLVTEVVMFHGELRFDMSHPDCGAPKLLGGSQTKTLRSRSPIGIKERVRRAYKDFLSQTQDTECGFKNL